MTRTTMSRPAFLALTDEQWDLAIARNLGTAFNVTRAVMPGMVERGWGRVVMVSSVTGPVVTDPGSVGYSAAKAGMDGLMRGVAIEVAAAGVTVNSVAPGWIATGSQLPSEAVGWSPHADRPIGHAGGDRRGDRVPRERPCELRARHLDRGRRRQHDPGDQGPVGAHPGATGRAGRHRGGHRRRLYPPGLLAARPAARSPRRERDARGARSAASRRPRDRRSRERCLRARHRRRDLRPVARDRAVGPELSGDGGQPHPHAAGARGWARRARRSRLGPARRRLPAGGGRGGGPHRARDRVGARPAAGLDLCVAGLARSVAW